MPMFSNEKFREVPADRRRAGRGGGASIALAAWTLHQMTMEVLDRYPELLSRILLSDTDHNDLLRHGTCHPPPAAARATSAC
jgi:hypothetical protein